jgi:uncharacterized protein (TIGR02646 family)
VIRVRKPTAPPGVLLSRGAARTAGDCARYLANRAGYRRGDARFEFDKGLYGDAEVRAALLRAQYGKCAFCESKIAHVLAGDVEHYRPKGGFLRRGKLVLPGYYWLAYDWDNLLLACQLCNQRHKRNRFPLAAGSRRARSHLADLTKEAPRYVHPAREDPAPHVSFREHVAIAPADDPRGRATIRGLGLNRPALLEAREHRLNVLRTLRDLVANQPPTPERARAERLLRDATRDEAEYAAMARSFLGEPTPDGDSPR